MGKTLTRTQVNEKKFRRINDKSLRQLLIHRFINAYGYDKGEVTAAAIVDDIVKTIEDYFVITLPLEKLTTADQLPNERMLSYGQLVWMAVPIDEYPQKGKSIIKTRMKPVILTYLADEDIESFRNGFTSRQLRINRLVRWCYQAYDQGALLTQLDLAVLLNVCDAVVSDYVNQWQKTTGNILPTRGNIHDLSGAITHKKEIVTLYLQGHLTPTIAAKTKHSKEAVDRYIRDYEIVKTRSVPQLTILTKYRRLPDSLKRVISQYLDLMPQQLFNDINAQLSNPITKQRGYPLSQSQTHRRQAMIKSHHGCLTLYPAKRRHLFLRLAWQAIAFLLYFVMTNIQLHLCLEEYARQANSHSSLVMVGTHYSSAFQPSWGHLILFQNQHLPCHRKVGGL